MMKIMSTTSKALPAGVETPKIISLSFALNLFTDLLVIGLHCTKHELTAKKGYRQIFDFFLVKITVFLASF